MQKRQTFEYGSTVCIPEALKNCCTHLNTDIYNIRLPIIQQNPSLEVYIELKGRRSDTHRYLDVNKFIHALHSDSDLSQVPPILFKLFIFLLDVIIFPISKESVKCFS